MSRRSIGILLLTFVASTNLGLFLPMTAHAGWDPDSEPPTNLGEVKTKCTAWGIMGIADTAKKRFVSCLDRCNSLDPNADKATWENACCALANPLTVFLGNNDFTAKLQESLSVLAGPKQDELLKKCKEVRKTTGTGECVFGKENRPGVSEECCVEKSVAQMPIDVNGKQCARKAFTGSASCKADGVFGCCICKNGPGEADQDTRVRVGEPNEAGYNCQSCTAACTGAPGLTKGVPYFDPLPFKAADCGTTPEQAAAGKTAKMKAVRPDVFQDMFCFTAAECAKVSRPENYKPGHGCPMKGNKEQGYCRSPEVDYQLQFPILGIKTIRGLKNFIAMIFNVGVGFVIVAAAIMFVWGAFKYLFSAVVKEIQSAQSTMIDSLIGLILGLGAYAILANINPSTLTFMSFDVDMINRLNFYNVVYCKSITPNTTKFAEAGTPDNPIDFKTAYADGYKYSLKDTQCGHEYFIEGADSVSTCLGGGCGGGGVCTNCSAMAGSGCRTDSTAEHSCVDADMAGNVILQGPWDIRNLTALFYCYKPTVGKPGIDEDFIVLKTKSLKTKNVQTQATQGDVGSYLFKFEDITKIKTFFDKKCKPEGMVNTGMLLTLDLSSMAKTLVACMGCPTKGAADQFLLINKNLCGKDMVAENQPTPSGMEGARFIYNFDNYFDYLYRDHKDYFEKLVANAWTLEEIEGMRQNPAECTIMATWSLLPKTGL